MLIYVTGVAGSGKSVLREQLVSRGYRAEDGDEGFCSWFDEQDQLVPTVPLEDRTPDWYAIHHWRFEADRVQQLASDCEAGLGFLCGLAANAEELATQFAAKYYLTAHIDEIVRRLRARDGAGHATRFAAAGSADAWQRAAEGFWSSRGYLPLDGSGGADEVADRFLGELFSR